MSNDIKVGDLVWVSRKSKHKCAAPRKSFINDVPNVFQVRDIFLSNSICVYCGTRWREMAAQTNVIPEGYKTPWVVGLYRLEKFRDFPESELRDVSKELEWKS